MSIAINDFIEYTGRVGVLVRTPPYKIILGK